MDNEALVVSPKLSERQQAALNFARMTRVVAEKSLADILGSEEGKKRAAQFSIVFRAAANASADPMAIYGCSVESVAACLTNSLLTGLMPGGASPGCYLIPKGSQLLWWINHRGIIELARRNKQTVQARAIFPGDTLELSENENGTRFQYESRHDPKDESFEKLIEVVVLVRGGKNNKIIDYVRMSRKQIEDRRSKSQLPNNGPWKQWPLEMALKTALKYALSRGIISISDHAAQQVLASEDAPFEAPAAPALPTPVPMITQAPQPFADLEAQLVDPPEQKADPAPAQ